MNDTNKLDSAKPCADTEKGIAKPNSVNVESLLVQVSKLESELVSKSREIGLSKIELILMQEKLVECVKTMRGISRQLSDATKDFKNELRKQLGLIDALVAKNRILKQSSHAWFDRSFALQANLLKAQDEVNATKGALALVTLKAEKLEEMHCTTNGGNNKL